MGSPKHGFQTFSDPPPPGNSKPSKGRLMGCSPKPTQSVHITHKYTMTKHLRCLGHRRSLRPCSKNPFTHARPAAPGAFKTFRTSRSVSSGLLGWQGSVPVDPRLDRSFILGSKRQAINGINMNLFSSIEVLMAVDESQTH